MTLRKQKSAIAKRVAAGSFLPRREPLEIAVAKRRQTPEEQRRFNAAFDVFLAELVRLHLDRAERP